eukprot:Selendium_serpulae@DN3273_c0_g1_i3.p1
MTARLTASLWCRIPEEYWMTKGGCIFFMVTICGMTSNFSSVAAFVGEKPVVLREVKGGAYSPSAYYVAKTISDIPALIIFPSVLMTLLWWMADMRDDAGAWGCSLLVIVLLCHAAVSWGYLLSVNAPTFSTAIAIMSLILMPMMFVSGFIINLNSLSPFWIWLVYISPFKWATEAVFYHVYAGRDFSGTIDSCGAGVPDPSVFCTGDEVMDYFGYNKDAWWPSVVALVVTLAVMHPLACLSWVFLTKKKEH